LLHRIQLRKENAHLKDVLETNITELFRKQNEHSMELTELEIKIGKTSDNVEEFAESTAGDKII